MMRSTEKTEHFPDELVQEILSRSLVKSLIQLKCVSKAWRTIISDPSFTSLHLNKAIQHKKFSLLLSNSNHIYSIHDPTSTTTSATTEWPFPFSHDNHDYYDIVGSCDGLLLLIPNRGCLRIWNPSTGDFMSVPSPSWSLENDTFILPWCPEMYGFGYGSNRSDYKIVSIDYGGAVQVKVFSTQSRSCTWRTIEGSSSTHDVFKDMLYSNSNGIFIRGALHWLGNFFNATTEMEKRVIAFDLGCEEFRNIPLPDHLKNNDCAKLSVWKESICLLIIDSQEWSSHIFVMKEYGVGDSWCKLYTIPEAPTINPATKPRIRLWSIVCFTNDGKILLQQQDLYNLVLYDTKSHTLTELELQEDLKKVFNEGCCSVYAYIPSLVPIRDNYCHV